MIQITIQSRNRSWSCHIPFALVTVFRCLNNALITTSKGRFRLAPQSSTRTPGSQPDFEVDDLAPPTPLTIVDDPASTDVEAADDETGSGSGVLPAPTSDDLTDTDHVVALSLEDGPDVDEILDATTGVFHRIGKHRRQGASVLRGRVLIAAMAAGGVAAAVHSASSPPPVVSAKTILASGTAAMRGSLFDSGSRGVQLITAQRSVSNMRSDELARGAAFAEERAEREARLQRPLFVKPTTGMFTSGFGYRWGALHAGIDLANAIGTPIYAVADGIVIDAGPTAGYGAWVKLRHADGTVTLYGHVNSWLVNVGQHVMAGDQIATIGNRGNSTGPHCHFEVMPDGVNRVNPMPWLAERGISVGGYTG